MTARFALPVLAVLSLLPIVATHSAKAQSAEERNAIREKHDMERAQASANKMWQEMKSSHPGE
jgi:hypothetical protein